MQKEKEKRRQKENVWITNRCRVNFVILKEARRKVTKLCRQAKINYFQREVDKHQSDPKQLFNITKTLLNKKESPLAEGEMKEIEKFITFLTNKIEKITEKFTPIKEHQARIITTIDNELASFTLVNAEILKKGNSERKLKIVALGFNFNMACKGMSGCFNSHHHQHCKYFSRFFSYAEYI